MGIICTSRNLINALSSHCMHKSLCAHVACTPVSLWWCTTGALSGWCMLACTCDSSYMQAVVQVQPVQYSSTGGNVKGECCTSRSTPVQVTRAEWACQDKGAERGTCDVLMELAEEHKIDLLVVGSFGRKGEKL